MVLSNFQKVATFHEGHDPNPVALEHVLTFREKFLREELAETLEAMAGLRAYPTSKPHKAALVKELVDVLTVAYGALYQLEVDADAAFDEVWRSNMSKTPNPGGKSIKGPGYEAAQMERFV